MRIVSITTAALLSGISSLLVDVPLRAQQESRRVERAPSVAPAGAAPRLPNGKPDLNGVWQGPYVPDMTRNDRGNKGVGELPYTTWGLQQWKNYDPVNGDYTGSCLPYGMVRSINVPYPFRIIQSDMHIALLFEANTWFHVIPVDGRDHPKDLEPTWFGHSVGRWDGDTLVVDTIGSNGYTKLDTVGHPHSDQLHVTQTFRRIDAGRIAHTMTIDDPKTYTRPWTSERTLTLQGGDLIEYSCEENNRGLWEGRIKRWTAPEQK
ncbi:MAG: hypothetical protein ACRD1Q_02845 [Vicinamibacterales bacterium]